MQQFNIKNTLHLFLEHWKEMLIIILGTLVLVSAYTFIIANKGYQSSASVMIGVPKAYLGGGQFSESSQDQSMTSQDTQNITFWVSTYSTAIKSGNVTSEVSKELGYTVPADQITLSQLNDTQFLNLKISADDPSKAQNIANTVIPVFRDYIASLLKVDNLEVVEEAGFNSVPISPVVSKNLLMGLLAGIILAVLYVIIRDLFDSRIRSIDDVKAITGVSVLTVVPYMDELYEKPEKKRKRGHKDEK